MNKNTQSLIDTRYDRLVMFYDHLKTSGPYEFNDFVYKGNDFYVPNEMTRDKNNYRKYLRAPMSFGNTKQYGFSLYDHLYKFYRANFHYYYIDCGDRITQDDKEMAFGTSIVYSYIAMSVFEIIKWLTGARNKYKLKITDEVFNPIFNFSQWNNDDYDANLVITMYPIDKVYERTIPLSIFK